jgi:hypothetical protein
MKMTMEQKRSLFRLLRERDNRKGGVIIQDSDDEIQYFGTAKAILVLPRNGKEASCRQNENGRRDKIVPQVKTKTARFEQTDTVNRILDDIIARIR